MDKEDIKVFTNALEQDIINHQNDQLEKIGLKWDDVYGYLLPIEDVEQPLLALSFNFWDGWCSAANDKFINEEFVLKDEWIEFAREIIVSLKNQTLPSNPKILDLFNPPPKPPKISFGEFLKGLIFGNKLKEKDV